MKCPKFLLSLHDCSGVGIGRQEGLKIPWAEMPVRVRPPSGAHNKMASMLLSTHCHFYNKNIVNMMSVAVIVALPDISLHHFIDDTPGGYTHIVSKPPYYISSSRRDSAGDLHPSRFFRHCLSSRAFSHSSPHSSSSSSMSHI